MEVVFEAEYNILLVIVRSTTLYVMDRVISVPSVKDLLSSLNITFLNLSLLTDYPSISWIWIYLVITGYYNT